MQGDKTVTIKGEESGFCSCDLPLFLGEMLHIYVIFVRIKNVVMVHKTVTRHQKKWQINRKKYLSGMVSFLMSVMAT
jgi:archaellum biogenesis protein FlaJ (TadC family)